MEDSKKAFKINEIMNFLPHRYPMLLIDRIVDIEKGNKVIAKKNVTFNEHFFQGHFPSHPVMPGVLIIEAMAQAAGVLVLDNAQNIDPKDYVVYFMTIESAQFRKPVTPGDVLELHVERIKNRGMVWKMKGEAIVDGARVANAIFSAMIVKKGG